MVGPKVISPRVMEGPLSSPSFYFMYSIWQDAGIRTRVAATAARFATNELHTSLKMFELRLRFSFIGIISVLKHVPVPHFGLVAAKKQNSLEVISHPCFA